MKVSDYNQIIRIQKERFEDELSRSLQMASIFFDLDVEEIELMPIREVNEMIFKMNNWLSKSFEPIELKIPNEKITLGNFIDLEVYLQNEFNNTLAILFRKSKLNEWGVTIFEPVDFDLNERAKSFNEKEVEYYLFGVNEYVKFREMIVETYKSIFGIDEEEEEIETDGLNYIEIKEIEAEEKKRIEKSKYSWENFVYWLAGEQLTEVENVLKFPILYALNMASMKKIYES